MSYIQAVRKQVEPELLSIPGVTGVGTGKKGIRVYVETLNPVEVPMKVDDVPVEVFETGKIVALDQLGIYQSPYVYHASYEATPYYSRIPAQPIEPMRTGRFRPVVGGVSIGHPDITAGTNGTALLYMGKVLALSNNHVLANASTVQNKRANIGDDIYQPGPYDGGTSEDAVGRLDRYIPIDEQGNNLVDAAVWEPFTPQTIDNRILELNPVKGIATAKLGETMYKSGRTTGLTSAEILDVDATVRVSYGAFEATFENQIITGYMSAGGDSGSAGLNSSSYQTGLLYAGSDKVTVFNHMGNVTKSLFGTIPPINGGVGDWRASIIPLTIGALLIA